MATAYRTGYVDPHPGMDSPLIFLAPKGAARRVVSLADAPVLVAVPACSLKPTAVSVSLVSLLPLPPSPCRALETARLVCLGLCRVRVRSPRANCLHALLIPEVSCLDDFVRRVCRVPMATATCVRRLHQASPLPRVEGRDLLCLYRARPAMAIRLTRALPKLPASHDPLCLLDRA